jgi:hypothetical protein
VSFVYINTIQVERRWSVGGVSVERRWSVGGASAPSVYVGTGVRVCFVVSTLPCVEVVCTGRTGDLLDDG